MFELAQRVDYVKNLIAINDEYIKGKFDDEFIDYINELFAPWYNTPTVSESKDSNAKYETFITNGIYKIVFPNKICIDISLFSVCFYEYLLNNKHSYIDWFAKRINIHEEHFKVIKEHVNNYMLSHDVNTLQPIVDNILLTLTAITYINHQLETFWCYLRSIAKYQKLMLLCFVIMSKYSKDVFNKRIERLFISKILLYYDTYTMYTFLCNQFGINPGWDIECIMIDYNYILNKQRKYTLLLNTELFTEQYKQFKQHLNEYVKDVLLYDVNKKLSECIYKFYITDGYLRDLVKLRLPQELNDEEITKDMNIIQIYQSVYNKIRGMKKYNMTQTDYNNLVKTEIHKLLSTDKV